MSTARDHLPAGIVVRIIGALALVMLPHARNIPPWVSLFVVAMLIWRTLAAVRLWTMPRPALRLAMAAAMFAGIGIEYGTLNGQFPGTALLIAMVTMKVTEMVQRRDYLITVFLCYFILVTHFLFSQAMGMVVYLFVATVAITAVLIDVNHPQSVLPLRQTTIRAGRMVLQALPLMLLFFVLFPRIPGPLWGLPSDAGAGRSGLSEDMTPGSINALGLSDAVAFRVRFDGDPPPRQALYWRGPVFTAFDGRKWTADEYAASQPVPRVIPLREPIDYELQLEAHGKKWLLPLETVGAVRPPDSKLDATFVLRNKHVIADSQLLRFSAVLEAIVEPELSPLRRHESLRMPRGTNPRARALAQGWRAAAASDADVVDAALRYFRTEPFFYSLQAPLLAQRHTVDQFLFETRTGFCEHFAGAFTVLMRAAGVPARVVTGYQGGEPNGDYLVVRQSDAHAWSEVWLPQRGWVRIDPTGAVAPERILQGLGAALPDSALVPSLARLNRSALARLQLQWDRIDAAWNRWFLAYGPELQQQLMRALGIPGLRAMLIVLTAGISGVLALVGVWMWWQYRPRVQLDPAGQQWQKLRRKLQRSGFEAPATWGPQDTLDKLRELRPEAAVAAEPIVQQYIRMRYAERVTDADLRLLARRIRHFRPA